MSRTIVLSYPYGAIANPALPRADGAWEAVSQPRARRDAELSVRGGEVLLDRLVGDVEPARDFKIRTSLERERSDLALALGQKLRSVPLGADVGCDGARVRKAAFVVYRATATIERERAAAIAGNLERRGLEQRVAHAPEAFCRVVPELPRFVDSAVAQARVGVEQRKRRPLGHLARSLRRALEVRARTVAILTRAVAADREQGR